MKFPVQSIFELDNYPNPFNPTTKIRYELPISGQVSIEVYNITGAKVRTLVNEKKASGLYEVEFDGRGTASGVYFYSLSVDGVLIDTKRMILLK